jgi:hypothetical protein
VYFGIDDDDNDNDVPFVIYNDEHVRVTRRICCPVIAKMLADVWMSGQVSRLLSVKLYRDTV